MRVLWNRLLIITLVMICESKTRENNIFLKTQCCSSLAKAAEQYYSHILFKLSMNESVVE